jgi:hypothetical protein
MRKGCVLGIGFGLLLTGIVLFSLNFVANVRSPHEVVRLSGRVSAGTSNQTYYHTAPHNKPRLVGEVLVEGGRIYFQIQSDLPENDLNTYVESSYNFTILDAGTSAKYTFIFDNSFSQQDKSVTFSLREEVAEVSLAILGWLGLLVMIPIGLIVALIGLFLKTNQKREKV